MSDNITLPRAVGEKLQDLLDACENPDWWDGADYAALAALDAALAEPEPEPDAIARAVEAEREAILKHCEAMRRAHTGYQMPPGLMQLIDAIRARGSK
jgi:hypothetical protein